ncbi:hypothetical protein OKW49_000494 [Paraburkholderia youngii]|uniref:hypothetical protein n=1 Tax=Paraburkholderia youngii TaxID=2782701 RepID=UPI001590D60D|nr:hypothetical protein [Paraburkholderia youngii]
MDLINKFNARISGKKNRPNMPIASITASLGAELLVEFDTVNVVADESRRCLSLSE